MKKILLKA